MGFKIKWSKSDEGLEDGDVGSNNKRWGSRKRKVQHERK